jgi:hypothetical protein
MKIKSIIAGAFALSALALTACGSSHSNSAPGANSPASDPPSSSPAATASPSSSTTTYAPAYSPAATGFATDSQGDKAELGITFTGKPVPLTDLTESNETVCGSAGGQVSPWQYEENRAVAIPVEIDAYLDSDLSTAFGVDFPTQEVYPGGNMQSEGNPPTWIQDTNSTGDCSDGGGEALWSNLSPHLAVSWTGYIVLPLAITPNDPSGLRVANRELLEMPTITAGMTNMQWHILYAKSHGVVDCAGAMPPTMIAANVTTTLHYGCTRHV